MAFEPDHAAFENREQPDGARADDHDVGLVMGVTVGHCPKVAKWDCKIKPPAD